MCTQSKQRTTTWGVIGGGEKCTRRGRNGGTPGFKVQYSQQRGDFNLKAEGHKKRTFIEEGDDGDPEGTRRGGWSKHEGCGPGMESNE